MKETYIFPNWLGAGNNTFQPIEVNGLNKLVDFDKLGLSKDKVHGIIRAFCDYEERKRPKHLTNKTLLDIVVEMFNYEINHDSFFIYSFECEQLMIRVLDHYKINHNIMFNYHWIA